MPLPPKQVSKLSFLWDFLFVCFVLFPLLTGGIWIRKPGMHIEITQPAIATAVLALWMFFQSSLRKKSYAIYMLQAFWEQWSTFLQRKPLLTLLSANFFVGCIWFLAAYQRHHHFSSDAIDLGIFTNAIWNLHQTGSPYSSLKGGISLLADHQNFLIYPISWLFYVLPARAESLLLFQSFSLAFTGVALFFLAKTYAAPTSKIPCMLPLVFWLYAPIRAANLFDFHPETLMLPLFISSLVFLFHKKSFYKLLGASLFLLASLGKESGGPVAAGIGLAFLLGAAPQAQKKVFQKISPFPILWGIALFFFDTKILPSHLDSTYQYTNVYAPFDPSLTSLLMAPFTHTGEFFSRLFGWTRWKFFFALTAPFALLPLLRVNALAAALPGLLMLFLTSGNQRLSLGYHYAIEPSVGVLFALAASLSTTFVHKKERYLLWILPITALLFMGRSDFFQIRFYQSTNHQQWVRDKLLPAIDPQKNISASSSIVPHIAARHWVLFLPIIEAGEQRAACILWDTSVNNSYVDDKQATALQNVIENKYEIEFRCGTTTLYREKNGAPCLISPISCNATQ